MMDGFITVTLRIPIGDLGREDVKDLLNRVDIYKNPREIHSSNSLSSAEISNIDLEKILDRADDDFFIEK